jgi:uncharacterized protein (TIGR02285 family)
MVKLVLTIIVFFIAFPVRSEDIIYWQTYHRPPGIIKIGADKGQGFVQKSLNLIIEKLPEYQHVMPIASIGRAMSDMKSGKLVCHPALYITKERKKYITFSQASMISPSNRLIARRGSLDKFVKNGSVDLNEILQNGKFTFALVKSRSYAEEVDKKLAQYLKDENITLIANTDLTAIFHMIRLSRVDLTILYPFELEYYLKNNPEVSEQFSTYKLKGVAPYYIGAIACPKNEWGNNIIGKIDNILNEIKGSEEYKKAITTWWESEREKPEFKQFYQQEFLTH